MMCHYMCQYSDIYLSLTCLNFDIDIESTTICIKLIINIFSVYCTSHNTHTSHTHTQRYTHTHARMHTHTMSFIHITFTHYTTGHYRADDIQEKITHLQDWWQKLKVTISSSLLRAHVNSVITAGERCLSQLQLGRVAVGSTISF